MILSGYDKELQHNPVMTEPYGEVEYGEIVSGLNTHYDVTPHPQVSVNLVGSYAHRSIEWLDKSTWLYDWYGKPFYERLPGGETNGSDSKPEHQFTTQDDGFGRIIAQWAFLPNQHLRLATTGRYTTRTAEGL